MHIQRRYLSILWRPALLLCSFSLCFGACYTFLPPCQLCKGDEDCLPKQKCILPPTGSGQGQCSNTQRRYLCPGWECKEGEIRTCYRGPAGTVGRSNCKAGTQACTGGTWSTCQGDILPEKEACNGIDDDCDGLVDEGVRCVITIAGSSPGDEDGSGPRARFNNPRGLDVDGAGNIYIADTSNHKIRKITQDTGGTYNVETYAGAGASSPGNSDGFRKTIARLNGPEDVAINNNGDTLYIADGENGKVRKINNDELTTVGSGSFSGPIGITVDLSGTLFVVEETGHRIRRISPTNEVTTIGSGTAGMADGPASQSQFEQPTGIAVDTVGSVYVADYNNNAIRKLTPVTNGPCLSLTNYTGYCVTTLSASTKSDPGYRDGPAEQAKFRDPSGVAVDNANNIYVADTSNHAIRKLTQLFKGTCTYQENGETKSVEDFTGYCVTTIAGTGKAGTQNGDARTATFKEPRGIAVDSQGNIYVSDTGNHLIRKIEQKADEN